MSRELDTWIAINIIGFDGMAIDEDGDYYVMDRSKEEIYSHVLPYSSDMNEAVKILRYFHGTLEHDSTEWNVGTQCNTKEFIAYHKDPATAICLAAYKLETGKDWE